MSGITPPRLRHTSFTVTTDGRVQPTSPAAAACCGMYVYLWERGREVGHNTRINPLTDIHHACAGFVYSNIHIYVHSTRMIPPPLCCAVLCCVSRDGTEEGGCRADADGGGGGGEQGTGGDLCSGGGGMEFFRTEGVW
jgi:hypothetical protein